MPDPNPSEETKSDFLERCVPIVLEEGTAKDQDQAVAVCNSYWEDATAYKDLEQFMDFED